MALALQASEAVKTLLRDLAGDKSRRYIYDALSERITLIRHDPGDRLARGVERQMQPGGIIARASVIHIDDSQEKWVLVWTAVAKDDGEAISLHHIEQLDS
jgi:hypothetical protein